jgi:hypothetical protein
MRILVQLNTILGREGELSHAWTRSMALLADPNEASGCAASRVAVGYVLMGMATWRAHAWDWEWEAVWFCRGEEELLKYCLREERKQTL